MSAVPRFDAAAQEFPHFFGPTERKNFSIVHWPERSLDAGVVLCPPLGYELVSAHHGLRELGVRLSELGYPVIRFDYAGTGNSIGDPPDTDPVQCWLETIRAAVEVLRSAGVKRIVVVGLRFGATLAAREIESLDDVVGLVLWDPVLSGRKYARSLQLLSAASADSTGDGPPTVVRVGGVDYSPALMSELRTQKVDLTGLPLPTLVAHRPESRPEQVAPNVEVEPVGGMQEFVDIDAELSVVPDEAISRIVAWVGDRLEDPATGVLSTSPTFCDVAAEETEGSTLLHRARRFGSHGVFGVETWCCDGPSTASNAESIVIMLNNGVAPQVGPARAWVDFSRRWASAGRHVVRVDLSGIGNSPVRPGERPNESFPLSAGDDIAAVVQAFGELEHPHFTLAGLCSGAVLSYDAALANPEISRIVSINGPFERPYADRRADRRKRAADPTNRLFSIPLSKTPLFPFFDRVPTAVWKLLAALRVVGSPSVPIAEAARRGVHSQLIFGDSEWGLHALQRRDGRRFRRLCQTSEVDLVRVPGLDHSMFAAGMSEVVEPLIGAALPCSDRGHECVGQRGASSSDASACTAVVPTDAVDSSTVQRLESQ